MAGQGSRGRVDVHHHFVTESYAVEMNRHSADPYGWGLPKWSVEQDQEFAAKIGVETSILSVTSPGVDFMPDAQSAADLARRINEEAASIRDKAPAKYGFFACIPSIMNYDLAVAEIDYALDVLKADGVTLLTRYSNDQHYLGHPDFKPIWAHLNSKHAVVFVHPHCAKDTTPINPRLPEPMMDYPHETTRTAIDMVINGTVRASPNCKIILSHAGGTLPYLAERPANMLPFTPFGKGLVPEHIFEDCQSFYFDTALSASAAHIATLKAFAKPGHVLFGSDYPYAPPPTILKTTANLDARLQGDEMLDQINSDNALALFPRLAKARAEAASSVIEAQL